MNYTQSVSFSYEPPFYRAGSSLTLICNVEGAEEDSSGLLYEWRSTCKGNCFVRSGHTKSVSTRYLHSYDSGEHTCVVYDRGGCTGNASTTVNVTGIISFLSYCIRILILLTLTMASIQQL